MMYLVLWWMAHMTTVDRTVITSFTNFFCALVQHDDWGERLSAVVTHYLRLIWPFFHLISSARWSRGLDAWSWFKCLMLSCFHAGFLLWMFYPTRQIFLMSEDVLARFSLQKKLIQSISHCMCKQRASFLPSGSCAVAVVLVLARCCLTSTCSWLQRRMRIPGVLCALVDMLSPPPPNECVKKSLTCHWTC